MDNLTHSLIGILLSRAGLRRLTPRATLLCVAAANVPDLDIVAASKGALPYLEVHRGWTHSLVMAPLLALPPLLLVWLFVRKPEQRFGRWAGAYLASLAAVLSHDLLDWLNVYGVRLFLPLDPTWFRLDLVFIVDIWIWALLLGGAVAPLLARLVNAEIGARSGPGYAGAIATLTLLLLFIVGRGQLHEHALATLNARRYDTSPVRRIAAFPTPANPWRWTGLVETDGEYRIFNINLLGDFDPDSARVLFKPVSNSALASAQQTASARAFLSFSQFPFWRLTPSAGGEGGTEIDLTDLRFGLPDEGRFRVSILLDAHDRPVRESFTFGTMARGSP